MECPYKILRSYKDTPHATSVHNDKLGNPDKIKVFGIRQTNITMKNTGTPFIEVTMGGVSV